VDNTIVREPGSGLPKIPGSSVAGVARAYLAIKEGRYLWKDGDKVRSCAGKGGEDGLEHCGEPNCAVCTAFGFSRKGTSFQGLAMFTDAQVLLFPVASMLGPQWVTSPRILAAVDALGDDEAGQWEAALRPSSGDYFFWAAEATAPERLNLGWIYLQKAQGQLPAKPRLKLRDGLRAAQAVSRLVMVHDDVLLPVVEDNLEVRTSVSIDPKTGTAAEGALFTAEAIPRGTIFWLEYAVLNKNNFQVPPRQQPITVDGLFAKVGDAMTWMATLGVGGLNTRGMGRMRVENWEK
jgi:CRISPR-associated protein Cmr4